MLSDLAVLLLSALQVARDEAQEAHNEALEWRQLEDFTAALRVRLEFHKHIEMKPDPNGSEFKVYRITQRGVEALKAQQTEQERPKAKRGRKPKAQTPEASPSMLREKIRRFNPQISQEMTDAIQAQAKPQYKVREIALASDSANTTSSPPLTPDEHQADGCQDCVYRQAIEILGERYPAVNDLVEALKAIDTLGK